jgi:hypothetical protein
MAVGNAVTQTGFKLPPLSRTVAELWDGTSWQIVPTPNPPGATWSSLDGISCPWRNVCFAVGYWRTDPDVPFQSGIPRPLVELWNGTSWSLQPSPDVPFGSLEAVSCSGLLACTAVGSVFVQNSNYDTLAERWDGSWHVQSTPNRADSQYNQLVAVSCPRRRTCTAVGTSTIFDTSGGHGSPLVERWFGRINSWGLQAAPKPNGAGNTGFAGVSCPDARVCIAVGGFVIPNNPSVFTLAERRIGSSWSVMPTPNGEPYQGSQSPVFNTQLRAVSCPGRQACHAVGYGQLSTGGQRAIDERFDGASWQLESIPIGEQSPADVSCPSRLFCMAVGQIFVLSTSSEATVASKWTP